MDKQEWGVVASIMALGVTLSLTVAWSIHMVIDHYQSRTEVTPEYTTKPTHLPTICRRYYNLGTDEWIKCMGVGYKRNEYNN